MPSLFPGMDPFLESHYFPTLHTGMITFMQASMQKSLPEGYFAVTDERVWIDTQRFIEPDVKVRRAPNPKKEREASVGVATLARPVVVTIPRGERTHRHLKVYKKVDAKKRLVCSIEILSPTNKRPGEKGQRLYLRKQRELLKRKVHLVEIDLLRAGKHTTVVPLDWARQEAGAFDYHVCVRRFNRFEKYDVYPILMQERLPTIAVPLLPADGDVALDLQSVFELAYDVGPYRRALDYRIESIAPPLSKEQDEWLRGVLKKAGINRKVAK